MPWDDTQSFLTSEVQGCWGIRVRHGIRFLDSSTPPRADPLTLTSLCSHRLHSPWLWESPESLLDLGSTLSLGPTLPLVISLALWTFLWFVGFCFLTNQWAATKPEDVHVGADSARAAITFSFFSIFSWVGERGG